MGEDACFFATNDTPEFWGAFVACCAAWVACYALYVRVTRAGAAWRHAWLALAKNCLATASAAIVLSATLPKAEWTIPPSHAALADGIGVLVIAYEWCDLFCYHLACPTVDRQMVAHHLLHGAMGLRMGRHCKARVVPVMLLCQEATSVILNVRFLAPTGSALRSSATRVFALSFLALRGALGWVPLYTMLSASDGGVELDMLIVGAAYLLQLWWCVLILRKVRAATRGKEKAG